MKCQTCGAENKSGARFCSKCGTLLGAVALESASPSKIASSGGPTHNKTHLGSYELRGELGRGAMAVVWRAWDPLLEREVAIKEPLIDTGLAPNVRAEMARRFVREAKTAARLNHPNIVTVYEAGVFEGRPAIVMELVEGKTLGQMLKGGPLGPQKSVDVLCQLLDALEYAHVHGVIHRDIKPENIFVDASGRVLLSDFGIARAEDAATQATVAGAVLGTPGYMSPEQAQGFPIDSRSDIFSVGIVAYEMLVGRNPFGAGKGSDIASLLYRIVHEDVPEIPSSACAGLPAGVRPAIMAALSKAPADRPQTAAAFKELLRSVERPSPTMRMPAAAPSQPAPTMRASSGGAKRSDAAAVMLPPTSADAPAARKKRAWLPYALIGGSGALVIIVVLIIALALPGSGGTEDAQDLAGGEQTADIVTQSAEDLQADAPDGFGVKAETKEGTANGALKPPPSGITSKIPNYYIGAYDGKVAVFAGIFDRPRTVSDVLLSDLSAESAKEVESHVGFDTVEAAEKRIAEYQAEAEAIKAEAARKAKEEEEARKAKEEEERRAKEEEEARKAEEERKAKEEEERKAKEEEEDRQAEEERKAAEQEKERLEKVLSSMDGWWHAKSQEDVYIHISKGSVTVYSPDVSKGDLLRTISTSDLKYCNKGLSGHFKGVSGYLISPLKSGEKGYYVTDDDFDDNGHIDEIAQVKDDGSGYKGKETLKRSDRPDFAE